VMEFNVFDCDKKLQIIDIAIAFILYVLGSYIGKLVTENVADTWIAFNGSVVVVLALGEFIWWRIRKRLIRK